jgi:hypothetical protein
MLILKDAYVLTLNENNDFGRYSLLIDNNEIIDMTVFGEVAPAEKEKTRLQKWIEKHGSYAEIIDCSNKIIMPAVINSCLKSEGVFIKYLMKNRHYESTAGDLYTDFIFNYLYQDSASDELKNDLTNIYSYSYLKSLKSGIAMFNEFSMRKDIRHLQPINDLVKKTGQIASACYPIRQDYEVIKEFSLINPSYYFTDENQMTVYDLSNMTELKRNGVKKLFFEIATNKDVTDEFRRMFGKPIVKLLDEYGLVDTNTSFINPLYLSYDELKIIADRNSNIIICPRDLMNFTNRYFPMDDFLSNDIRFSIATGWLGGDIFKEVRVFRNKYRELGIPPYVLLKSITQIPRELYFNTDEENQPYGIEPGRNANFSFIDLSDVRFQFHPENLDFENVCTFIIENVTSFNFSDVMINGEFKMRNSEALNIDENEVLKRAEQTRAKLYVTARYEEISERQKQKKSIEMLALASRDDDEIKLFSDITFEKAPELKPEKEEFRIKGRMPVFRKKTPAAQKNLFEETDKASISQAEEYLDTPVFNLLYTEIEETKGLDEEVKRNRLTEEKIIKQASGEKKKEKPEPNPESKIELPKNVKLKFGGEE